MFESPGVLTWVSHQMTATRLVRNRARNFAGETNFPHVSLKCVQDAQLHSHNQVVLFLTLQQMLFFTRHMCSPFGCRSIPSCQPGLSSERPTDMHGIHTLPFACLQINLIKREHYKRQNERRKKSQAYIPQFLPSRDAIYLLHPLTRSQGPASVSVSQALQTMPFPPTF